MSFNDFQLVNLLRRVEQDTAQQGVVDPIAVDMLSNVEAVEAELRESDKPFMAMARERARQIAQLSGLGKRYWQFVRGTKAATSLLTLAMLIVGFMATLQALNQADSEINIYWLLLLLLGFNTLSILFWLLFTLRAYFGRGDTLLQSPIISAFRWLMVWFSRRAKQGLFFANWSKINLFGRVGQWFTSTILHGVWVAYLTGGLLALLIALAGKQYDFVWGTTILPEKVFIGTTEKLGALPSALGFVTPDRVQIVASKKGHSLVAANSKTSVSATQARSIWANFLVACIVLYGILPRCVLWLLSNINLRLAKRQYAPNWGQAYFLQLRARLLPEHATLGVVDPDQYANHTPTAPLANGLDLHGIRPLSLPANALVTSYEWGDSPLPTLDLEQPQLFGAIDEKTAQEKLFERLNSTQAPLILFVPLQRVVDRGAARLLKMIAAATTVHLVVVRGRANQSDSARWAAWKMTAERIKLATDHVHLLSLNAAKSS